MLTYINTLLIACMLLPTIKRKVYSNLGQGSWQVRLLGLWITYVKSKQIQNDSGQFSFSVKNHTPLTVWLGSRIRLFPDPELVRR
jgi:hypothetical protein